MERIHKATVFSPGGNLANVADDTTNGMWYVGVSATNTAYLPEVMYGEGVLSSLRHRHAETERQQISFIGADTETVTVSTRYKVILGNIQAQQESQMEGTRWYAYKSPAALTGTANTDRLNMYTELETKINSYAGNNVAAYLCYKLTFSTGTGAAGCTGFATIPTNNKVQYGSQGTQAVTNVTMNVAYYENLTDAGFGGTTTGYLWLYNFSDYATFTPAANAITFADATIYCDPTTGAPTTIAESLAVTPVSIVAGQGLAIVDDSGYNNCLTGRKGKSAVFTDGFTTAHAEVVKEACYESGVGTNMLAQIPVFGRDGRELIKGSPDYDFVQNQLPVVGTAYCKIEYDIKKSVNISLMSPGSTQPFTEHFVIWAAQTNYGTSGNADNVIANLGTMLVK
ncbi:MAG: hypothetical protein V1904_10010 [Bacteroidota bacterium]